MPKTDSRRPTPQQEPAAADVPEARRRGAARVLVASDNAADLEQIVDLLKADHPQVAGSLDPAHAVADFETLLPQVVVLAFKQIQKSDGYLLSLYRHSHVANSHLHRTVLLCSQAEARPAYELCKKGCYDDYVLYWPMAQDGLRLSLSVWNEAQEVLGAAARPSPHNLAAAYARQVEGVQTFFEQEVAEGHRFSDTATGALDQVQVAVGAAIDDFQERVTRPAAGAPPTVRDAAAFARELERLRHDGVGRAFREGSKAFDEAAAWPVRARGRLESMATRVRALARSFSPPRGTLMIVEDDEVQRELIAAALHDSGFELMMLSDGASLIGAIRRKKPDMILMDIHLPDLDGVTLTRMITGLPRLAGVPVLMLTGAASRESLAKSVEAGAVGYIVKPFTRDTLLKHIGRFLPEVA
jgi:CheY-like chemotaxis protein